MTEPERLVKFEILGQEYQFYTASSEKEMQSILSLVRQLVETDPTRTTGTLPIGKIAVMACLNLASRYVKLEREFENYRRDADERIVRINEEIRSNLLSE